MSQQADPFSTVPPEQEGKPIAPAGQASAGEHPSHIGRYRVERLLGQGGFGRVYLAHDDQLRRPVAVKVPRPERAALPGYADSYLAEARIVAGLDHPHIVPVHDVGQTDDGLPFVVSRFIEGTDLAGTIRQARPSSTAAAALVATVAEALHYAHRKGLVHRDIKPSNILLDTGGRPYVADFGLALREEDFGKGAGFAGTPSYMSPEQARGEGHRVDGRSDIFSLGTVFYELLTGRRPFRGETLDELFEQITCVEPRPPRQVDDTIPRELERICLKALAKRATERYPTGLDLADDLRHFLDESAPAVPPTVPARAAGAELAPPTPTPPVTSTPEARPVKIVPKGLRSFDAHDADFFLELLPGPRDREGLPDSIRFWKTRIEETDADNTFAVGLIYGPSGCGKSSLVKAGLLPRLSGDVIVVYVEATAEETEARLLKGLRKRCPALPANLGVTETLAALRRGQGIPGGKKVLIVLDQFEQWLHAKKEEENTGLVQALRQCDGGRVQCIVMVRDDFWLAVSRFLKELEIRLVEGQNSALADLFAVDHARKVLAAFGRAFERLPETFGETSREQKEFLNQAVAGLAQDGKIVCVRLALFAEMMKGKAWTPATLKEVGGTQGVGVTFLEETFTASTAPPQHRLHQKAARAVLKALLPEAGTDIKGHMRSHAELLEASGHGSRPNDFADLIRILDSEIRLITPTDPEGKDEASASSSTAGVRYYQLTHDYLVPSLRDWLTRKQKETHRGRAELLLADRAAVWNARPENRQLPSIPQWVSIRLLTRRKDWTLPQQQMMRRTDRYHLTRGFAVAVALLLLLGAGWEGFGRLRAVTLRDHLLGAPTSEVPGIMGDMAPYRRWADPLLRQAYAEAEADGDARKQLHTSLALLPVDTGQVEYLYGRLLAAEPHEVVVLREALRPHVGTLGERLWTVLENAKGDRGQRLRAACALAAYAEDDARWGMVSGDVAARLVAENALVISKWADALQPVGRHLLPPLAVMLLEEKRGAAERRTITGVYAGYAEGVPNAFAPLEAVLREESGPKATLEARLARVRRQANAAVALAALGRWEKVVPLLRHGPDPTLRSYLIDRLGPGGTAARAVIDRLDPQREPDVSARRALLLALGEFDQDRLPPAEREALVPSFLELYRDDPDPGTHGAAGWLLRQWGQQEKVEGIDRGLATGKVEGKRHWYVNGQGQTMVVVPPGKFETVPPVAEVGHWRALREGDIPPFDRVVPAEAEGKRVKMRVERRFALAAREVTVAEFQRFRADHTHMLKKWGAPKDFAPTEDCPVNFVSWYDAAHYCNWLSEKEGIAENQRCYVRNDKREYAEGMKVKGNALGLSGYRLPTEWEWELACRAGSVTPWSMGEAEDLLGKYAWYGANSRYRSLPVGLLRPNDLGLFDLHGNDNEWCQNRWDLQDIGGRQLDDKVDDQGSHAERGGSFLDAASGVGSALRRNGGTRESMYHVGFRVARTFR